MRSTHVAISTCSRYCGRNLMRWKTAAMVSQQERPGRKPSVWGASLASHAGSKAWRTSVCRARSSWVGRPSGRFSGRPRLGIHVRRRGVAWPSRRSSRASCHRWGGSSDFTPSMPAVCFPRVSWVTRRTAHSRAYQDLLSRFWSLRTVLTSPRCVARYIRFWRRKTWRWTFFQGMSCQAAIRVLRSCVLARGL